MASLIEDQFRDADRYSRGVRQAGFWVLHKSAAPSVLVELGFISNASEEKFLNTEEGKDQLTKAIFNAFEIFKRDYDKKSGKEIVAKDIPAYKADTIKSNVNENQIVFKIQLFALEKKISPYSREFKKLTGVNYYREGNFYKYTIGEENSFEKIEALRKKISDKFPHAYIIAFRGEQKITVGDALKNKQNM